MRDDAPAAIGRFQVIRTLGTGAQGSVFLARDPHLNRDVAIKSIAAAAPVHTIERLLQEARVVSQFSHPNIVTLYDAGEDETVPYLVFEYVEGKTLAALIREQRRLPSVQAVDIAQQLLRGIRQRNAVLFARLHPPARARPRASRQSTDRHTGAACCPTGGRAWRFRPLTRR